ncbi:hypothetical protein cypCar_00046101, partial [Cyprinus carpio]
VQALVVEVNTIPPPPPVAAPGPLRVELRLANGQCVTKGCAEDPASLAPLQETIFIHCSTAVCHPSSGSCEQSCSRMRRDTHVKSISSEQTVVSSGEVTLIM